MTPNSQTLRQQIMPSLATELWLPMRCGVRACRRERACGGVAACAGLPCLVQINEETKPGFAYVLRLIEAIVHNTMPAHRTSDVAVAAVEDLAIKTLDRALPLMPGIARHYPDWRRRYFNPEPEIDAGALARELAAELERDNLRSEAVQLAAGIGR